MGHTGSLRDSGNTQTARPLAPLHVARARAAFSPPPTYTAPVRGQHTQQPLAVHRGHAQDRRSDQYYENADIYEDQEESDYEYYDDVYAQDGLEYYDDTGFDEAFDNYFG